MDEKEVVIDEVVDNNEPEIIYEGEEGYEEKPVEVHSEEAEEHEVPTENKETESEKPKKPRVSAKTRINQKNREYHEQLRRAEIAEKELHSLKEENERLRKISENSNKAMLSSQESMIDSHIRNAKQVKAKAIEDGDIQAQLDADEALAAAVSDKRRIDEYKIQQKMYEEDQKNHNNNQQHVRNQQQSEEENYITPEASEWLADNAWFDEDSEDFDPDLYQKALNYSQHLNRQYQRLGKTNRISTYEYFDDIDKYMSRHINTVPSNARNINSKSTGDLVMNRPRGTVAGVGRTQPAGGTRETFRMSREEQDMARAMGWSDQQWFQNKKLAAEMESKGRLNTGFGNGR
jgi:hypothetical protein